MPLPPTSAAAGVNRCVLQQALKVNRPGLFQAGGEGWSLWQQSPSPTEALSTKLSSSDSVWTPISADHVASVTCCPQMALLRGLAAAFCTCLTLQIGPRRDPVESTLHQRRLELAKMWITLRGPRTWKKRLQSPGQVQRGKTIPGPRCYQLEIHYDPQDCEPWVPGGGHRPLVRVGDTRLTFPSSCFHHPTCITSV